MTAQVPPTRSNFVQENATVVRRSDHRPSRYAHKPLPTEIAEPQQRRSLWKAGGRPRVRTATRTVPADLTVLQPLEQTQRLGLQSLRLSLGG